MRAVITRVKSAEVKIDGATHSKIGNGLLILLGVSVNDTAQDAEYLAKKISMMRIFEDSEEKMNLSCSAVNGSMMVVSNFTLCANTQKGNRPSFVDAARPELARPMYEYFVSLLRDAGYRTETGVFGAYMELHSVNDGPITIVMDTEEVFGGEER
ncbi:MAG: D-tyrosyl-tRNA(Tyr) deacylase [Oscillospiraceae bacterium]|nr:D-tyrosyl-tRNA(Tyr) deacylase [Oscillospiraceae bacterium]